MDLLAAHGATPRVLIVEDDPVSAMLIQRLFQAQGVDVHRAPDGRVALQMHQMNSYRLVVSDWMMPNMSGVELCREFRKLDGPYVYFILCSAKGQRDDRIEAFEAGVDDFLSKPLDREELRSRLKVARRILSSEEHLQFQKAELEHSSQAMADMNDSLRLASRRFEELFNGLPVACFTFDEHGLIHEWNRSAQTVFGIEAYEAFQRPVWEVLSQETGTAWKPDKVKQVFAETDAPTFDWTYQAHDGNTKYLACNVICLRSMAGRAVGAVCANLDITERKVAEQRIAQQMEQINEYASQLRQQKKALEEMNAKLNHLAVTDGLTGLWNHRRFQEMMEDSMSDLRRYNEPFSLILMDIDFFKRYNDDYGHQVGDDVLIKFAHTLRDTARATELPARYGGEEFAVILQRTDEEGALVAAQRFQEAIRSQDWPHRALTCSLGVTTCSDVTTTPKSVIAAADTALYYSKETGRDKITPYSSMPSINHAA